MITVFERLKISAQVALQWDREDYRFLTQQEAWDAGYDAFDDGILILLPTDIDNVVVTADPKDKTQVEISDGLHRWRLDTTDGEIEIYS